MQNQIILRDKDTGAQMLVDLATGAVKRLDADTAKAAEKPEIVETHTVAPARIYYREEAGVVEYRSVAPARMYYREEREAA